MKITRFGTGATSPAPVPKRGTPPKTWTPDSVITECGCILLDVVILDLARKAHCTIHGWQPITRRANSRDEIENIIGKPLTLDLPDIPQF